MNATLQVGALVTLIVAFCEAFKFALGDSRFIPLIAVVLGVIGSIFIGGVNWLSTAAGVVLGLSTTGGYALVKSSLLNK